MFEQRENITKGGIFVIHIFPVKSINFLKEFFRRTHYSESKHNKEENEATLFEEQFSLGR